MRVDDKLKAAFQSVHAPEEAKRKALYGIERHKKGTVRRRVSRAFQIACAGAACVLALVCMHIYGNQTAYISLDVNPSIALAINDFGLVIAASGYGKESEQVLDSLAVDGLAYADAVEKVLSAADMRPYLEENGTVWISVQAKNPAREAEMEQTVQSAARAALDAAEEPAYIESGAVSEEVRVNAEDAGVSATKYIAIIELQEVDPSVDLEALRDATIYEIHEQTASHHATAQTPAESAEPSPEDTPEITAEPVESVPEEPAAAPTPQPTQTPVSQGHHGNQHHGGAHHG